MDSRAASRTDVSPWPQTSEQMPATWEAWLLYDNTYYRKTSNIRRTLVDNKIVDHSDEVGASPVGAAPTTSSFST